MLGDGRASKSEVLHWAKKIIPNISSFHIADSLLYLEAWRKEHMKQEYDIRGGVRGKYYKKYDVETDPKYQEYKDAVKENLLK